MLLWGIAGYMLLVFVYCIPVDRMKTHLESTVESFQGGSKTLVKDDTGMWLDYLTDSTILAEAIFKGDQNPFEQAAAVYSDTPDVPRSQNWPYEKLSAAMEEGGTFSAYARYWHGFLLYLKPLLFAFDYKDILTLNMLGQLLMVLWIAQLLVKRNLKYLLLPEVLAFGMLNLPAMALCLQYMPCFFVMAAACVVVLKYPDFTHRHKGMFFLSVGMATCYFDFLTFPLVTLGIPLVLYWLLCTKTMKERLVSGVQVSFFWGIGYVVFWMEKWVIGSLVLGENLFEEAWNSLLLRSSHETGGQQLTYLDTLKNNLSAYNLRIWKVIFVLLLVGLVVSIVLRMMQGAARIDFAVVIPLLLVAVMPLAWYFATINHSYIHYGYTHKELIISAWAISCMAAELFHRWHTHANWRQETGK